MARPQSMAGYILNNTCVSNRDAIHPVFVERRGISAPGSIPQSPKEASLN